MKKQKFPETRRTVIKSLTIGKILISIGLIPEIPITRHIDKIVTNEHVVKQLKFVTHEIIS